MKSKRDIARAVSQVGLGAALMFAGASHLTVAREEFRAQVPAWLPVDADQVVIASGVAELLLGASLAFTWKQPARSRVGKLVGGFFVVIFPGNIAQFVERKDGFGLDTDLKRLVRLPFQPALVAWAVASTRK